MFLPVCAFTRRRVNTFLLLPLIALGCVCLRNCYCSLFFGVPSPSRTFRIAQPGAGTRRESAYGRNDLSWSALRTPALTAFCKLSLSRDVIIIQNPVDFLTPESRKEDPAQPWP